MRLIARIAAALGLLALVLVVVALVLPDEPDDVDVTFDPARLDVGVDAYLREAEARFDDIVPGTRKRVRWAGETGTPTDWAVIYLHGFSASSEEIRPVPENVADALGANLYYTRLSGHGRDAEAMGESSLTDWMRDVAEAMAIGRAIGERVLILSTSTGGTLATIAAADPEMSEGLAGMVLLSPNYRVGNPVARVLRWPGVRWWGPLIAGERRGFTPANELHAKFWTEDYPFAAVLPMAEAVGAAAEVDHAALRVPALFIYAPTDKVVDPSATQAVAADWGGPVTVEAVTPGPEADPSNHVIAGDILSPSLTGPVTERILGWIDTLPGADGG
ncbi:Esterase/lipase [Roseivivax marinus]|uniref:alpha/beta hydrolase n=1 Tax=Roseivivax marinus TaxID=1379903 RepID=UPI0008CF7811|nr:alpha/beta fold hydrolase [Roseivivax marinus]SEK91273.1 Esterase/lipase [Roseivivax marinus]